MNQEMPAATQPVAPKASGMSIASLVLGIVTVLGGFYLLVPPILAVVFGHIGLGKTKKDPNVGGKGLSITGLILGYLGIAIFVAMIVGGIIFAASMASNPEFMEEVNRQLQEGGALVEPSTEPAE